MPEKPKPNPQSYSNSIFQQGLKNLDGDLYWQEFLTPIFTSPEALKLENFLMQEALSQNIYPHAENIFAAFKNLPADFSVLILGQDPYHNHEIIQQKQISQPQTQLQPQAHGLAFSVPKGFKIPPSLKNIEKELMRGENIQAVDHGDLSAWVPQGVLLLNTALTVRARQAASHSLVWQPIMHTLLEKLANTKPLIFVLWGGHAQKYEKMIHASTFKDQHHILSAPHPSPLSAYRGFLGCGHFTKINEILKLQGLSIIDWQRV